MMPSSGTLGKPKIDFPCGNIGWLYIGMIPLLTFGVISFFSGISSLFKNRLHETCKNFDSWNLKDNGLIAKLQNPQYVANLQSIGYSIEMSNTQSKPASCSVCGTIIDDNYKFCPYMRNKGGVKFETH